MNNIKHDSKKMRGGITKQSKEDDASERAMERTTKITTSYVFRAPKPQKMAVFLILLCLIVGFIINFDFEDLSSNFSRYGLFQNIVVFGLILLGFPALLSAIFSTPAAELLGGIFYLRRSVLLSFVSIVIIFGVLLAGKIIDYFIDLDMAVVLIFGYALIISIRHSVLLATSNHRHLGSLPASINQTLFGYLFICAIPNPFVECNSQVALYMLWFTLIFLATTVLWLHIITRPFHRNFGANGLLLMKHALTQFTEDPGSGRELEREFFSKIGANTNVRVGTVCFRKIEPSSTPEWERQNGKQKLKSLWVVPSVHPGPFGHLGGSNLPYKLYQPLRNLTSSLMVFHGPTTHDYNPAATSECKKVSFAIEKMVNTTEYSEASTPFLRKTLDSIDNIGSQDSSSKPTTRSGLNLCGQRLGNGSVYIHTSSPESTDDIDYPVGEGVIQRAQNETKKRALFIDAHNCLEPGTGQVYFGSEKANNLMKLVSSVNHELKEQVGHEYKMHCGYAENKQFKVSDGLGPLGIQVLVVKCETELENNNIKTNAYILMDGNNVVPGLREKILKSIAGLVDEGEVFTTDNHVVNATMGGYNPVGLRFEQNKIINIVKKLVGRAIEDCEPCEVGMNSTIVKNIRILGQNTPLRLSATINSTISIMKSSLLACEGLALMLCLFFVLVF